MVIYDAGFNMNLRREAALHSTSLTNVTVGKKNKLMTPYEIVLNERPSLEKLRIFGCAMYTHKPKEGQKFRLSARAVQGILLRCEQGLYQTCNTQSNALPV